MVVPIGRTNPIIGASSADEGFDDEDDDDGIIEDDEGKINDEDIVVDEKNDDDDDPLEEEEDYQQQDEQTEGDNGRLTDDSAISGTRKQTSSRSVTSNASMTAEEAAMAALKHLEYDDTSPETPGKAKLFKLLTSLQSTLSSKKQAEDSRSRGASSSVEEAAGVVDPPLVLPQQYIAKEPQVNDVLTGRGTRINKHDGNIAFRQFISLYKVWYLNKLTKLVTKSQMCAYVVEHVRELNPPGRFLEYHQVGIFANMWVEIGDERARRKAAQVFREDAMEIRSTLGMPHLHPRQEKKKKRKRSALLTASGQSYSKSSIRSHDSSYYHHDNKEESPSPTKTTRRSDDEDKKVPADSKLSSFITSAIKMPLDHPVASSHTQMKSFTSRSNNTSTNASAFPTIMNSLSSSAVGLAAAASPAALPSSTVLSAATNDPSFILASSLLPSLTTATRSGTIVDHPSLTNTAPADPPHRMTKSSRNDYKRDTTKTTSSTPAAQQQMMGQSPSVNNLLSLSGVTSHLAGQEASLSSSLHRYSSSAGGHDRRASVNSLSLLDIRDAARITHQQQQEALSLMLAQHEQQVAGTSSILQQQQQYEGNIQSHRESNNAASSTPLPITSSSHHIAASSSSAAQIPASIFPAASSTRPAASNIAQENEVQHQDNHDALLMSSINKIEQQQQQMVTLQQLQHMQQEIMRAQHNILIQQQELERLQNTKPAKTPSATATATKHSSIIPQHEHHHSQQDQLLREQDHQFLHHLPPTTTSTTLSTTTPQHLMHINLQQEQHELLQQQQQMLSISNNQQSTTTTSTEINQQQPHYYHHANFDLNQAAAVGHHSQSAVLNLLYPNSLFQQTAALSQHPADATVEGTGATLLSGQEEPSSAFDDDKIAKYYHDKFNEDETKKP